MNAVTLSRNNPQSCQETLIELTLSVQMKSSLYFTCYSAQKHHASQKQCERETV